MYVKYLLNRLIIGTAAWFAPAAVLCYHLNMNTQLLEDHYDGCDDSGESDNTEVELPEFDAAQFAGDGNV